MGEPSEGAAGRGPVTGTSDPADTSTSTTTGDELVRAVLGTRWSTAPPALLPGQLIAGVYEIVERLGAGGMGVVYLARDRRLARSVALKLLRSATSNVGVERLVREAQAIAQLSHPNVVTVYQIDSHDGQPFVAMEYVDGGTARSWRAARPRTWREIVTLYLAAGRGLEAAHRADLVHRDFKPDNVLVGRDGRVRVADFGLVQSLAWATIADDGGPAATPVTLTNTGAVMGTPAYMAPEQRRSEAVGAAADQFAFAVSVWEALTGARPFRIADDGTTTEAIVAPRRPIPRHLELALRRALAVDPTARWPTMAPLLAELARDASARRRRVAWVAGGVAAAAAVVVPLAMRGSAPPTPCGDSAAAIAPSWNGERRTALLAALGPRLGATVTDGLDRYAAAWTAAHRQACRDTRVTRSQSEDMLDRRMQCLFAARAAIDATVTALGNAGPETRARAAAAIGYLPGLDRCGDLEALAREAPLPNDPVARRRLEEAQQQLAAVHAAHLDPNRIDRLQYADEALATARQVGWSPLVARALAVHAQQLALASRMTDAIAELREAASLAITANLPDVGAVAFADLAIFLAERDQVGGAEVALLAARAFDERSGPEPLQSVITAGASVASAAGKYDEAIALSRQAVAFADQHEDPRIDPMASRGNLTGILRVAGRFDEALPIFDEALAWGAAHLGPDHAEIGRLRGERAGSLINLGRFDEAIADAKAGLAILETWYGPDSHHLANVLLTLGDTYSRAGQPELALPILDRALACVQRGDDVNTLAAIEYQRAVYLVHVGELDRAASAADSLVTASERTGAVVGLVNGLLVRGYIAREQKRYPDSEADFRRGLELGKSLGEHPVIFNLRVELAKTLLAAGQAAAARTLLATQGQAIASGRDVDPLLLVETQVVLASSLHALRDRRGARAAIAVADQAASAHPDRPDLRAMVDAWHAAHR